MIIQTYDDAKVQVLDKTVHPQNIIQLACDITQKKADDISERKLSPELAKYLLDAEHTSVFEHSSITLLASGLSRSFLAQVTRERMFSPTSASQHYQDYRDYPMSLRPGWDKVEGFDDDSAFKAQAIKNSYNRALYVALEEYIALVENGEPPEEARQVLPNACTINMLITANPRALVHFLRTRLCARNTKEMKIFAHKLWTICMNWIPEIFTNVDAPCIMNGKCNQGKMSCKLKN